MMDDTHYRILVLDDTVSKANAKLYSFDTLEVDRPIKVTTEKILGNPHPNNYSLDVCREVARETRAGDGGYHAIIISGDYKVSFVKAVNISPNVYKRTVIVWEHPTPEKERNYIRLGFQNFCKKADLLEFIPTILLGINKNAA